MIKHFNKIHMVCALVSVGLVVVATPSPAHAKLATVGAVHDYVKQKWDIEIPRGATDSNLINMNYLMQVVDVANEELNGFQSSNFSGDIKYSNSNIVAIPAARGAVDTLIKPACPPDLANSFCFIPATTSNAYSFVIGAAGNYTIDWGDGQSDIITKSDTVYETYSHTYLKEASKYRVFLTGRATAYDTSGLHAAISFSSSVAKLSSMSGCLGCIFSTIDDESVAANARQPRFVQTFQGNADLRGEIPEGLFAGINGAPVDGIFRYTFKDCSRLTSIPEKLFAGIKGDAANSMFDYTFGNCTGLTGSIPENLFAGITPSGGVRVNAFASTFYNCSNLTGYSPKIDGRYLYEIWPSVNYGTFSRDNKLADYACIPTGWGGAGTKQPGECEPDIVGE